MQTDGIIIRRDSMVAITLMPMLYEVYYIYISRYKTIVADNAQSTAETTGGGSLSVAPPTFLLIEVRIKHRF